jgi:hypothetical protein
MSTLILVGLSVAVLLAAAYRSTPSQPQPPQIIYVVQPAQVEPTGGTGCLPLLVLVGVALIAIATLR